MEVRLKKTKKDLEFIADNGVYQFNICSTPNKDKGVIGFSPMELILEGVAGCMSIDIMMILKKQRQLVESYEVVIRGNRVEEIPRVFERIDMQVHLKGAILPKKIRRAIDISAQNYCSVLKMIEKAADVRISYVLNGIAEKDI